jgi:hypothetical protein
MIKKIIIINMAIVFAVCSVAEAGTLRLAYRSIARALIVIPDDASVTEEYASQELKTHLDKMTGGTFRIIREADNSGGMQIHVGRTNFALPFAIGIEKEAFTIRNNGKKIALIGGSDAGTLYAVFEFLEEMGVKWLVPDEELGTVIPLKPDLYFRLVNKVFNPAFELRGLNGGIWGLRNKSNFIVDSALPFPAFAYPEKMRIHTMDTWLPPEIYYAPRPELYAFVDGSRDPFRFVGERKSYWKEETGSEDTAMVVAENICEAYKKNPLTERFLLSPLDGTNWSQSPESMALDEQSVSKWQRYSRRYYVFYTRVAELVGKCAPDARVIAYAYHYYTFPPDDRSISAPNNLELMVAHYTPFDLARPMSDPGSACNALFVSTMDGWEELFGKKLYVFEYYWKLTWLGLPWPIAHTIAEDIPYLHGRGVKGILSQSSRTGDVWVNGLNFYLAAKLLWNPDLDPETIKKEWIRGLFAEVSKPMEQYYNVMENSMAANTCISGNARINALKVFTPPVLSRMRTYYEQALDLAVSPIVKRRLDKIGLSLRYTEVLMRIIGLAQNEPQEAAALLRSMIDEYEENPSKYAGIVPKDIFEGPAYLRKYLTDLESRE